MVPHWSAEKWIDALSKGGGQKKRFQYCLKPNCPEKLLYFRAIEGHSEKPYSGNARINPAMQDNVLLLEDFTKYTCHIGNGKELRSIVRNGLVPGGFSTKAGRQAVFFTVVNPMDDEQGLRETFCDLSKARICALQKYLETTSGYVYRCNLLLAQEAGLQFNPIRYNAPSDMHENERTALPKRERKTTCCSQSNFAMLITRSNDHVDYRVPGISLSAVQQQDEQRQHTVAKLIEKFESHQHKEQFLKDMSQTQKINRFSEASQQ